MVLSQVCDFISHSVNKGKRFCNIAMLLSVALELHPRFLSIYFRKQDDSYFRTGLGSCVTISSNQAIFYKIVKRSPVPLERNVSFTKVFLFTSQILVLIVASQETPSHPPFNVKRDKCFSCQWQFKRRRFSPF